MTAYAIGKLSDSEDLLPTLLEKLNFDTQQDTLWFTGNHIQLDKPSLSLIRFIKGLGKAAISVLGDEDIRLLAMVEGSSDDEENSLEQISQETDFAELLKWLRQRPLMHYDKKLNIAMVHAGIPPEWTLSQARTFAIEVESALSFGNHKAYLDYISSKPSPRRWNAKLHGWKRLHFITNAFTKMQNCNAKGYMDFGLQVPNNSAGDEYIPWYSSANRLTAAVQIIFSHTASPATQKYPNVFSLNTANDQILSVLRLSPTPETISVSI